MWEVGRGEEREQREREKKREREIGGKKKALQFYATNSIGN